MKTFSILIYRMNFFFFLPERFFHFRGIHKYMTDTQKHIIDLVMDPRSVHDLAVFQLRTPGKVRSKVFSSFVDSWVVHSELGLSHNLYPLTLQNLSDAFRNAGVDSQIQGDRLHAKLSNVEISLYADPDCTTIISADAILARVQLCAEAIAKLVVFADSVILDVEEMVLQEVLRMSEIEKAAVIIVTTLRARLYAVGRPFDIKEDGEYIRIQLKLYPSGKISMKLPAMEALEKADLLEEYARHAEFLYSSLGRNFYITELEGYAFWAKED